MDIINVGILICLLVVSLVIGWFIVTENKRFDKKYSNMKKNEYYLGYTTGNFIGLEQGYKRGQDDMMDFKIDENNSIRKEGKIVYLNRKT